MTGLDFSSASLAEARKPAAATGADVGFVESDLYSKLISGHDDCPAVRSAPGIPLDRIQVETEGDLDVRSFFGLDDAVRPGFGEVRVKVTLDGPAEPEPERYRELQEAVDRRCPVLDLFSNPTTVVTSLVEPA